MRFKKAFSFLFALVFIILPYVALAQNQNIGFVETNIWYSKDPFVEGDKIKVYTLVFNPSAKNFKGTVAFFDKTTLLGKKEFSISSLTAEVISIDWLVTVGGHQVFARIENPRFEVSAGKYEEVELTNTETEKSERTVAKKLPDIKEVKDKINNTLDSSIKPIEDLKDKVTESLPPSVSKPINSTFGFIEEARLNTLDSIDEKRSEVKKEIEEAKESTKQPATTGDAEMDATPKETTTEEAKKTSNLPSPQTPLKYVWLFFLTILGYVFKYKILFYVFALILLFVVIRLIFRLIKK